MSELLEMEPLGIRVEVLRDPNQTERLEVVSGAMKGEEHVLTEGHSIEIPPGTPHTQVPIGDGDGRVRIQVRPAGRTQEFLERLALLCSDVQVTRLGFPSRWPALSCCSTSRRRATRPGRGCPCSECSRERSRPWRGTHVAAPAEAVFDTIARAMQGSSHTLSGRRRRWPRAVAGRGGGCTFPPLAWKTASRSARCPVSRRPRRA